MKALVDLLIKIVHEKIEEISEDVHDSWQQEKKEQGFHPPTECDSKLASEDILEVMELNKSLRFIKFCDKCRDDMFPYPELPENIKEYDRVTVRAVFKSAIKIIKKKTKNE